jgi:hypothetical protein
MIQQIQIIIIFATNIDVMDLSKILAISGKPGLYKTLSQSKNGFIVESLQDGKRFTAFTHERISTLEEISIYTEKDDIPLKKIFKTIFEKQNGEPAPSQNANAGELKSFFEQIVPDYDKERVYVSDIKKVVNWFNILQEHKLLDFTEEEEKKDETGEGKTEAKETKPAEELKKVKKTKVKVGEKPVAKRTSAAAGKKPIAQKQKSK